MAPLNLAIEGRDGRSDRDIYGTFASAAKHNAPNDSAGLFK